MVHKPIGYVCSRERDFAENRIIYDLLPPSFIHRLPPLVEAGRLDKYASGLVVLSQNGPPLIFFHSPLFQIAFSL